MSNKNEEKQTTPVLTFSKEQIVNSEKYNRFQDFLQGNLDENKMYSMREIDSLLERNMKGKVR